MGQRFTVSFVVSVAALSVAGAFACGHGGGDADTADDANTPQPNQDQVWSFSDEVADLAGADPSDGGDLDQLPGANGPDPDAGPPPNSPPPNMPAGWETFTATECGVTVWLPHHAKDHPNAKTNTHSYRYHIEGQPDGAYLIQCTHSPAGAGPWMSAVQKRLAKRGTISSTTPVTLPNATGSELKIDLSTGGEAQARLLVTSKGEEILLFTAIEKRLWSQSDADAFMQSAQIQ
jgi:hypothetical protein